MHKYILTSLFTCLLSSSAFAISGCYGLMGVWKGQVKVTTGEVIPLTVTVYSLADANVPNPQPGDVRYALVGDINDNYFVMKGGCAQAYTDVIDFFINNKIAQIDSKSFKLDDGFALNAIQNITGTYDNKIIDSSHPENNYLIKTSEHFH